jgi:hypothetical protein
MVFIGLALLVAALRQAKLGHPTVSLFWAAILAGGTFVCVSVAWFLIFAQINSIQGMHIPAAAACFLIASFGRVTHEM